MCGGCGVRPLEAVEDPRYRFAGPWVCRCGRRNRALICGGALPPGMTRLHGCEATLATQEEEQEPGCAMDLKDDEDVESPSIS